MTMTSAVDLPVERDFGAEGRVRFDGAYYDWTDAVGQRGMRLWVPPGGGRVRAVLFHGNPGGSGDTRELPASRSLQELAVRHGWGISGVAWFPGSEVYRSTGKVMLRVFELWADLGVHPELAHVPLMPRGSSNSGVTAYALACFAPERVIAFAPNVGPSYAHAFAGEATQRTPGLLQIGIVDPFFPDGELVTRGLFADLGRRRALAWAWLTEEGKGHQVAHSSDVDLKFLLQVASLRLPEPSADRSAPVELKPVDHGAGWWFDEASGRTGVARVWPVAGGGERPPAGTGWVPTEDVAVLCRALATFGTGSVVDIPGVSVAINPNEAGIYLREGESRVVESGRPVELVCNVDPGLRWRRIDFLDGARLLGSVEAPAAPRLTWRAEAADGYVAVTALVHLDDGTLRPAKPARLIVSDPATSASLEVQRAAVDPWPRVAAGPRSGGARGAPRGDVAAAGAAGAGGRAVVAWALSAGEEAGFAVDGRPSAFWERLPAAGRAVVRGAGAGLEMEVRAAHSDAGLYLMFSVADAQSGEADEVDFHVAGVGTGVLYAAEPGPEHFQQARATSLVRSAYQYHVPLAPGREEALVNQCIGWTGVRSAWAVAELRERFSILADRVPPQGGRRVVEVFLPWAMAGKRAAVAPAAGETLAVNLGYNGSADGRRLRWPGGLDVWNVPASGEGAARPWADLVIGGRP